MDDITQYLEPIIPDYIWYCCFVGVSLTAILSVAICKKHKHALQVILFSILCAYIVLTLCNTILLRETMKEGKYELDLFWSYRTHVEGGGNHLIEKILNVVLFMPIGFLLGGIMCVFKLKKTLQVVTVAFFGCAFSSAIEMLQFTLKKGTCEFDDVVHNTIGSLVGCAIFYIVRKSKSLITR